MRRIEHETMATLSVFAIARGFSDHRPSMCKKFVAKLAEFSPGGSASFTLGMWLSHCPKKRGWWVNIAIV